ncbi:MAG TPA: prephenate dehydrogenase/arogenate dehydrogenase family protein [Spirochaetota bacterium]|nr:prephenate dehydrogenase/arogenate dehydrogenase family protein [Spirochaetota bacterium]HQQ23455.1 prephenate dehydrogenase/arogenate dehydrogenase family protein [Spirochaetota bacterium]
MHRKIGIIGGTGGMGSLFSGVFKSMGHTVTVTSRHTAVTPEECALTNDIVIITVPINHTIEVISRIAPLVNKDSLLMDFTSLKKREVDAMLQNSTCEVIGCHPVFGPSVNNLQNQVIVLTPARGNKWIPEIAAMFKQAGALIEITTPEKHDEVMAIVQGLIHFTSITLVNTMRKMNAVPEEIEKFASPVYRMRVDFAERILNQNPELYADIAISNPKVPEILETYIKTSQELLESVISKNRESFIEQFKLASDYLGDTKIDAEKRTDRIIDFASKLKGSGSDV